MALRRHSSPERVGDQQHTASAVSTSTASQCCLHRLCQVPERLDHPKDSSPTGAELCEEGRRRWRVRVTWFAFFHSAKRGVCSFGILLFLSLKVQSQSFRRLLLLRPFSLERVHLRQDLLQVRRHFAASRGLCRGLPSLHSCWSLHRSRGHHTPLDCVEAINTSNSLDKHNQLLMNSLYNLGQALSRNLYSRCASLPKLFDGHSVRQLSQVTSL